MRPQTNHFKWQEGKLGKPFRLSSIKKGKGEKWIGRVLKSDWYYIFKYQDGNFFALHENFKGEIIEKLNNDETIKLITDE